jgi:predicted molibdopterin-dependent oxidoreductase YjgC
VVRAVAEPPGEAKPDFEIFRLLAEAWGCGDLVQEWASPEDGFAVLQRLSAGRPFDITGIRDYDHLAERGGIQWPCPTAEAATTAERRLFADGRFFTPTGRARFAGADPRPPEEQLTARHPLVLLTGRGSSAQWHTGTRTSKSPMLRSLSPQHLLVQISPTDAEARGIAPDDEVMVATARGEVRARAHVTPNVAPGQLFLPMHHEATNLLTVASFDPQSRQPSYKWSAAEVRLQAPRPGRPRHPLISFPRTPAAASRRTPDALPGRRCCGTPAGCSGARSARAARRRGTWSPCPPCAS